VKRKSRRETKVSAEKRRRRDSTVKKGGFRGNYVKKKHGKKAFTEGKRGAGTFGKHGLQKMRKVSKGIKRKTHWNLSQKKRGGAEGQAGKLGGREKGPDPLKREHKGGSSREKKS